MRLGDTSRRELGRIHRLSQEEREGIIRRLRKSLMARGEIIFALIFGGFLDKPSFHDIDIALYLREDGGDIVEDAIYAERLSKEFGKLIDLPVDVVILNHSPMWLRYRALRGIIRVEGDPLLSLAHKFAAAENMMQRWRDRGRIFPL